MRVALRRLQLSNTIPQTRRISGFLISLSIFLMDAASTAGPVCWGGIELAVIACARLNSTAKAKHLNSYCAAGLFQ